MRPDSADLSRAELGLREERAHRYDEEYAALHGPWFLRAEADILLGLLYPGPDDVVLDLGCGTGRLMPLYAPRCRRAYAVDRSPASLEVLRARARDGGIRNVTPVLQDVTRPFRLPERVTRVLCVQVLQHVPTEESRRRVVVNAAAAIEVGGRAVFVDEAHGLVRRLRGKEGEVAEPGRLFFHPFEPREYMATVSAGGFSLAALRGMGICYWAGYRPAPRTLAKADVLLSRMPVSPFVAKFLAVVATPAAARHGP